MWPHILFALAFWGRKKKEKIRNQCDADHFCNVKNMEEGAAKM